MTINENGLLIDEFSTIYNRLADKFKLIYGQDINLEQNSPDGQLLGIITNEIYDLQTLILHIYNSFDPDLAQGVELNKLLKLIAQTRRASTKSIVDITIVANANVTLPADYTIIDENKNEWVINAETTLISGTNIVSFNAVNFGAIEASANTINDVVTVFPEITSVNNALPAEVGRDEESDVLLRKRRNNLLSVNSNSTIAGIYSKLFLLDTVTDAVIYENATDTYDALKDLNAHTLWCIIDGGSIDEITKIIATDKTIGTDLKGTVSNNYVEIFLKADGTTRALTHIVKFDRPTEIPLYIKLTVSKKIITDIIDMDAIKNKLVEKLYSINEKATATELYAYVYSVGNTFIASNLEVSKDNITFGNTATNDYDEKFIISAVNIAITKV